MRRDFVVLVLSVGLFFGAGPARAATVSLANQTLTATVPIPSTTSYGNAVVTSAPFDARYATSVVIQGTITLLQNTSQDRTFMQIGLLPRSSWTSNGAFNTGVYIGNWEAQGDGLSLSQNGVGGPYVWPLQNASSNKPWNFTITMTPSAAGGGTVTFAVAGQTLLGTPTLNYTGDLSDALLAVQLLSSVSGTQMTFSNLTATATMLTGDANHDGVVNSADVAAVEQHLGQTVTSQGYVLGDANGDGRVDGTDVLVVERNFGAAMNGAVIVPEPAGLAVVLVGAGAVVMRGRGR